MSTSSGSAPAARRSVLAPPVRGHSWTRSCTKCHAMRPCSYSTSTPTPRPGTHSCSCTAVYGSHAASVTARLWSSWTSATAERRQAGRAITTLLRTGLSTTGQRRGSGRPSLAGGSSGERCSHSREAGTGNPSSRARRVVVALSSAASSAASDAVQ